MCRGSQESRELGLFGIFLAISAWIECESTSSSVIAPRLFPFLYMSIFVWLAAGSPCFRAAAAYINECLLRHLRTLLVRIRASTGLAALASATVRLMQNTTRMGRWQLHQETGPQQAKRPCARGARIRGDDQVGTDGSLGGSPESGGEQVEAGEERRKELKGEKACPFRGVWLFTPPSYPSIYYSVFHLSSAPCMLTLLSFRLTTLFIRSPIGSSSECTEPSGEAGCLFFILFYFFYRNWRRNPHFT